MREILVCTDNWNGVKNEHFIWNNPDKTNAVTFTQVGSTWPFTLPPGFSVPAGGKLQCGLVSQPNTYQYNASPCKTRGNPKTVIIT